MINGYYDGKCGKIAFKHMNAMPCQCTTEIEFKVTGHSKLFIKNLQNLSKIWKKGTICEILNLNNRRLRRLKVRVI